MKDLRTLAFSLLLLIGIILPENKTDTKLIFIYNSKSGFINEITDLAHKMISPETYPCDLYALTYDTFAMKQEWSNYIDHLPMKTVFMYKDKLTENVMKNMELPAVFLLKNDSLINVLSEKEFNNIDDHGVTIGIESPNKNQGVQYLFHETYHPGAINLDNGNVAIKFLVTNDVLDNENVELPSTYSIKSVYPNPFNPSINIELFLYATDNIELSIVDINGRVVHVLHDGPAAKGRYHVQWNAKDMFGHGMSTGVYFVYLASGSYRKTIKILYLK